MPEGISIHVTQTSPQLGAHAPQLLQPQFGQLSIRGHARRHVSLGRGSLIASAAPTALGYRKRCRQRRESRRRGQGARPHLCAPARGDGRAITVAVDDCHAEQPHMQRPLSS
jgi:hypothetical protein